jgi:heat shock protein HslJ/uncharacterized lipoprotein YbaY
MVRVLAWVAIGLAAGLSGCAGTGAGGSANSLAIRGTLTHVSRVALPENATALVELRDTTSGERPVVAEQRTALGGKQAPIPFEVVVDRAKVRPGRSYSVRGGILESGRPTMVTDPVPVDVAASAIDVGTLVMKPVRGEAFVSEFHCGDQPASIGFTRDRMRLTVGNETFDMRQVPTASGTKHEAVNDPTTTFWSKGKTATLAVRGRTYPECTVAAPGAKPFRATGNEPFWRLDMAGGETTLLADLGKTRVAAPTPAGERVEGGIRYAANTSEGPLTVTVFDRRCNDTMTGMPHPHAVTVQFAGRTLQGCGGDPATLLQGREWVVEDINRTGVIDRSRTTLSFGADGHLVGMGSCNTYLARYSLSGEGLAITRPASTVKACPPALMRQEDLVFDILAKVQRFEIDPTGALVLRASDGRSITARRP